MDAQATSTAEDSATVGAGSESPAPTAPGQAWGPPAGIDPPAESSEAGQGPPGFRERGGMRRRVRFLRKARELAYRDLGGLVFEMHRLGQRNDELVAAKLSVLASFDRELRALEAALGARQPVTVLHESGIAACPRCAAIHGGEDRFCPACGMPLGRHADRPLAATPAVVTAAPAPAAIAPAPTISPAQLPLSTPPVASPQATPTPVTREDRPTEIIRPPDKA
jgi:hypothetical protein